MVSEHINVIGTCFCDCVWNVVLRGAGAPRPPPGKTSGSENVCLLEKAFRAAEGRVLPGAQPQSWYRGPGHVPPGNFRSKSSPSPKCRFVQNANTTHSSDV